MKKKNKKKEKKILIIILIIIIVFLLLYFFINDKEKNNFLFNSLKDLTADISKVTVINNKDDLNKEITKEINKDYQNEIGELKKTLNLNTVNSDKEFINATVIKRSTKYWYDVLTIDKGKKDGIKKDMAVVTKNGFVGKITTVSYIKH